MKLFDFIKDKKLENKENILEENSVISEVNETYNIKKFTILCINFNANDFSFTLTANNKGKININNSNGKIEIDDIIKTKELSIFIDDNLLHIKELAANKEDIKDSDNNMLQFEIDGNKYTLFRDNFDSEKLMKYDRIVHEIAKILGIKKNYENFVLDFCFDYPNNYESLEFDIEKYCLLAISKPVIIFKDADNKLITLEYMTLKNDMVNKMISSISSSEDYKILKTFNRTKNMIDSRNLIVQYNENNKIEFFSFIVLEEICILLTAIIDDSENVDINRIEENNKYKEIIDIVSSFKIITRENLF